MKTEVVMKRELFGREISQKSKSEFFSETDLVRAGNIWRMTHGQPAFSSAEWLRQKGTSEFVSLLKDKYVTVRIPARGRGQHTWIHPLLFIDMALAISPSLKIEVYEWLYDHLLRYRNDSGDSYKRMSGALYLASGNKSGFPKLVKETAARIKRAVGADDWNRASEEQLDKRDKIHDRVALLADIVPVEEAIRIGIEKTVHP